MNCSICATPLKRNARAYCSRQCWWEDRYNKWISEWLEGKHDGLRGGVAVSRYIRKYMVRTFGEKCSICGWKEVNPSTNTIPVHLDHIDGNWKNNKADNLRFLCPNHHALTSTYGSLNSGKGRPFFVQKKV